MDQNDEQREKFLELLGREFNQQLRKYRFDSRVQLIVMLLIAIAGFFTGAASLDKTQTAWYAQSSALLLFGGISTVGAAFYQFRDPVKRSNKYHNRKIALKVIKEGILFGILPLDEAKRFHSRVWTEPEQVINDVLRWESNH